MKNLLKFILAAVVIAACTNPKKESSFDPEKAKAAIAEANQKFMDAVAKGDSASAASMYHSQGWVMAPNADAMAGSKITSFFSGSMKMGITSVKLNTGEVWGDDNQLIETGTYEVGIKDGSVADKGKYLVVWRLENGQWKLYRDMWNSNMPMPMAEVKK